MINDYNNNNISDSNGNKNGWIQNKKIPRN